MWELTSLSLNVTQSLILAAFSSIIFASWALTKICGKRKHSCGSFQTTFHAHKWTFPTVYLASAAPSIPVFPAASLISLSQHLSPEPDCSGPDTFCTTSSRIRWFVRSQTSAFPPWRGSETSSEGENDQKTTWICYILICTAQKKERKEERKCWQEKAL